MFEQLVAHAPDVSVRGEAALYAGIVAAKLDRREDSERYLTVVLQTPGMEAWRPQAQIALMSNRYEEGKYREVIDIYRRSSTPAQGESEARRKMLAGRAYMQLGKNVEAVELFQAVQKLARPESDLAFDAAYFRLLCFYRVDGEHVDEAADAFLQIYRKGRPNDPRIHTALLIRAETLFQRRRHREAAETFNSIDATLISEANRPGLLFQRGWCLATAGDYQGAIRSLNKFLADYPDDPRVAEALAKRGEAHLENGSPDAALKDFDELISREPGAELATFAWQQSARICKDRDDLPGMIRRYSTLLEKTPDLEAPIVANASYWIGWGHFKTEKRKEALPWLRKARELDPKTYGKQAGIVLILILYSLQDIDGLADEIDLAFDQGYIESVPAQALRWIGTQVYNADRFEDAARFLSLAATPQEPRQTPKVVWRYLAKAQLRIDDAKQALESVGYVLEVEDEPIWIADALLDKARALLALDRAEEALEIGNEGLAMRPQGRIGNGLRLVVGDSELALGHLDEAIGQYVVVANLVEDTELRPMALKRLIGALEKKGAHGEMERYRKILREEFPDQAG
jgi:tetratricopeptide (TPR) repeat protein